MFRPVTLALCLAASPALATPEYVLPTLFDVSEVASGDVLNIRARPDAAAPVIGSLAPDATRIEVVAESDDGRWGLVNTGEGSGWVSMRFLNYRTDVWNTDELPARFACHGTEPFWSVTRKGDALEWATPESSMTYPRYEAHGGAWFRDPARMIVGWSGGQKITIAAMPAQCSDGMSDRAYGLRALVLREGQGASESYTGCCSVAP
ncbi:MAG: SH3 domain-containing protein [Paracoccus sp. (in: a-proteobacteria)]|uniref:COG3650 family protein n=1 Tax=Paracoccus sp. TaxID=267 RepID=UPI0026DF8D19|nr:SH3 domain-containing protein [Paracoccus sp. (in: a-proteobacteria)]MDO5620827.1 SH3 domain-containing protein [Paracoccus sp. (in: a-proteobacteria)]